VDLSAAFSGWLKLEDSFGSPSRHRLLPPVRTFWLFLEQALSREGSCRAALRGFQLRRAGQGLAPGSPSTSAYCQARGRLKLADIQTAHQRVVAGMTRQSESHELWCGRRVKVVDGTCLSLPDTPANQRSYPQQRSQAPGCGFPLLRLVALFCLASGALLDYATDSYRSSEHELFRRLWRALKPGDVVLGDRGFGGYAEVYSLLQQGVDCVFRKRERTAKARRVVERINKHDRIVDWRRTAVRPAWLNREQWRSVPERMPVREIKLRAARRGWRTKVLTVVTTLLDPADFPAEAIAGLYRQRWCVELYLLAIKDVMGMDILSCKSPAMAQKELAMKVIAYNLVRAVMLQAAIQHGRKINHLSFKGAVDTLKHWASFLAVPNLPAPVLQKFYQTLLALIARDQVPARPGRSEPRAVKRRPKPYQILNKPRTLFKENPHRGKRQG
jgi:hypothetical protein